MQHSQDEKGTDLLALFTAFVVFPGCAAAAGWMFGPIFNQGAVDRYAVSDALQKSMTGAVVGLVVALLISGTLMLVRRVWHHTNPPVGHEESPEP